MDYMKAKEYANDKIRLPDGSIISVVIWLLPQKDSLHPHGFKYRLNFCNAAGKTLVRYDNERGKGDHRHLLDKEEIYIFKDIDSLLDNFWRDVAAIMEHQEDE